MVRSGQPQNVPPATAFLPLADEIRLLRMRRGWTQEDLASELRRMTGRAIPRPLVSKWEAGWHRPSRDIVDAIDVLVAEPAV